MFVSVLKLIAITEAFFEIGDYKQSFDRKFDVFGKQWTPQQTLISSGLVVVVFVLKQLFLKLKYGEGYSTLINRNPIIAWSGVDDAITPRIQKEKWLQLEEIGGSGTKV